jgi:hypothetical protein
MATIKVACPKCGQKVSGDESFHGTVVECPVCSADIRFPGRRQETSPDASPHAIVPVPPEPTAASASEGSASPPPSTPSSATGPDPAPSPAASPIAPGKSEAEAEEDEAELPPSPLWGAISIVSAVLSVVICGFGGVLFAPLAIIFGHTALAKARLSPVQPAPGHTLGAIGLMIGYVSLTLTILLLVVALIFIEPLREFLGRSAD